MDDIGERIGKRVARCPEGKRRPLDGGGECLEDQRSSTVLPSTITRSIRISFVPSVRG